jgi:hypothetical protein
MLKQSLRKKSIQPILELEQLHNLVMELDKVNEESLSGGTKITPIEEIGVITNLPPRALVLLFANPFA